MPLRAVFALIFIGLASAQTTGDIADLKRRVQAEPQNSQLRYQLGFAYFQARQPVAARRELEFVVRSAPPALPARYLLGRIAIQEGRGTEALRWLKPVAASGQRIFDTDAWLSKAYEMTGRPQDAVSALESATLQEPWDGSLYYRLGRLHQTLGHPREAEECFRQSRQLKLLDAETVRQLQQCGESLRAGDRAAALRIRDDLLGQAGTHPNAILAAGVLLASANLSAEALPCFEAAAQRDPGLTQATYNAGLALLRLGRAPDAELFLAKAVAQTPESFEAQSALGTARVLTGRFADAVAPLKAAERVRPGQAKVEGLLGLALVRTGDAKTAVPLLRKVVARTPDDPRLRFVLIEALNASHAEEEALQVAKAAAQKFPQIPQAQLAEAQQLARLGQYQEAGLAFERVLALAPDNADARIGRGEVRFKAGRMEEALADFEAALGQRPGQPAAEAGAARSLIALNRFPEARARLESALHSDPDNAQLRFELARVYARLGETELAAEQNELVRRLREKESKAQ